MVGYPVHYQKELQLKIIGNFIFVNVVLQRFTLLWGPPVLTNFSCGDADATDNYLAENSIREVVLRSIGSYPTEGMHLSQLFISIYYLQF